MRDVLDFAKRCLGEGRRFAIAVVTATSGSSPRQVGSMMAVAEDGSIAGSVSGGCVESAVVEAARRAITSGRGERLAFDKLDPEDLFSVGLSCGGSIEVLVSPWNDGWGAALERAEAGVPFDLAIEESGAQLVDEDRPAPAHAFLYRHRWADQLIVVGGVHIAVPLLALAKSLGFETVLVEPREAFASIERFPVPPDALLKEWPDAALDRLSITEATYAVLLTHDPKIDDVALRVLLRSPARYIGVLGSKATHAQRCERLAAEGFATTELDRIHGPVGLDIRARSPEEIALSILAEIVLVRNGAM